MKREDKCAQDYRAIERAAELIAMYVDRHPSPQNAYQGSLLEGVRRLAKLMDNHGGFFTQSSLERGAPIQLFYNDPQMGGR